MKFLVTGAAGQLGQAVCRFIQQRGYDLVALSSADLDIVQKDAIDQKLSEHRPDFLINCAAYTLVDQAESDSERCFQINDLAVGYLAQSCNQHNCILVHVSTDFVFDGLTDRPYTENDDTQPINVYGQSKWQGEERIRELCPNHIILRVSWLFGPDGNNFMKTMLQLAQERTELKVVDDQRGLPTYTCDAARVLVAVCEQLDCHTSEELWGTYHYGGFDTTSWYGFTQVILHEAKWFISLKTEQLEPTTTDDFPRPAQRPMNSSLNCRKILSHFGIKQRPWRRGVIETLKTLYPEATGMVSDKAS